MPNQPHTPARSMRIPDDEWQAWDDAAKALGYANRTEFVRDTVNRRIRRQHTD